ncbi:MAG: DUF1365 domain-containing protein [Bacteroidetes bacterium]|nr:DUF1365 domain-containing protein [Bacteroidota bacterium]
MHHRFEPKKHRFHYNVFMFCIDLDSLDEDLRKISFVGRNRFNLFSFYDKDHPVNENGERREEGGVRAQLNIYLRSNGVLEPPAKVLLITNLRLLGYVFNPVSFYFCYDEKGKPLCAVAEVQNTFREMKMYFIGKEKFDGKEFHLRTTKYFYVSPFIDHDAEFDFHLELPGEKMNIRIDDYKNEKRLFISTLTGNKKELTSGRILGYFFRFPLITLRIIFLIHWNAMLLWFKKIRFFRKKEFPELQRDVMRKYKQ